VKNTLELSVLIANNPSPSSADFCTDCQFRQTAHQGKSHQNLNLNVMRSVMTIGNDIANDFLSGSRYCGTNVGCHRFHYKNRRSKRFSHTLTGEVGD